VGGGEVQKEGRLAVCRLSPLLAMYVHESEKVREIESESACAHARAG